jgi:hypothetical protein
MRLSGSEPQNVRRRGNPEMQDAAAIPLVASDDSERFGQLTAMGTWPAAGSEYDRCEGTDSPRVRPPDGRRQFQRRCSRGRMKPDAFIAKVCQASLSKENAVLTNCAQRSRPAAAARSAAALSPRRRAASRCRRAISSVQACRRAAPLRAGAVNARTGRGIRRPTGMR